MNVRELLAGRPAAIIEDDATLAEASRRILAAGLRDLAVVDADGKLVGVVGEREVLAARLREGRTPMLDIVRTAMLGHPPIVGPNQSIEDAAALMMERGVSSVPVVQEGEVVGLVTMADFVHLEAAPARGLPATVGDLMMPDPVTVSANDNLAAVIDRMTRLRVRHLPVVTDDRILVGMVSDRDIRTAIGEPTIASHLAGTQLRLQAARVADVMARKVVTVRPEASLAEASARFIARRVGALPVIDDERRLVGILSYVDLLRVTAFAPRSPREQKRASRARASS